MDQKSYQEFVDQVTPKVNGWLSFFKALRAPKPVNAPSCTLGPSLPRGIPTKKVIREETNVAASVKNQLNLSFTLDKTTEKGIPPPFENGAVFIM